MTTGTVFGRLVGRTALVTGGAQGIGLGVCERFVADGARVLIGDINVSGARRAAEGLGQAATPVEVDVVSRASVQEAIDFTLESHGSLDILVNAAGATAPTVPAWELDDATWAHVIDINLSSVFYACTAAAPIMMRQGYGRIVNVASLAGMEGKPRSAAYSAAKAGVIALTKSLGKELCTAGVLVNAVAPTAVATPMLASMTDEARKYMLDRIPMNRAGRPEELAALISWLSSEECSFSTGAVYDFSGGRATY
jgi:3-oxoacyl-[acyl-carrier protein] reductase